MQMWLQGKFPKLLFWKGDRGGNKSGCVWSGRSDQMWDVFASFAAIPYSQDMD